MEVNQEKRCPLAVKSSYTCGKRSKTILTNVSLFILQVGQIEKVFTTAHKQRNWDHFSKAQRKNLELWHKQLKVGHFTQKYMCHLGT